MLERTEIERILHDDLEQARALYDSETADFRVAIRDMIPTDANYPDGTRAIRTAGTERRAALEAYGLALKRFTAFIIDGIVPDDLKPIRK
jgi:hypothetical protein